MRIGKGPPFVTSLLHCRHDPVIGRTRSVANGWPKADAKLAQGFCVPSYFQGTPEETRAMQKICATWLWAFTVIPNSDGRWTTTWSPDARLPAGR